MRTSASLSLAAQARLALRRAGYNRQGSKANRRQQIERACSVMDWIQRHRQVHHLGQVGSRQVIDFWKAHRGLSEKTAYGYWLALCHLWEAAGKAGKPPEPHIEERGTAL